MKIGVVRLTINSVRKAPPIAVVKHSHTAETLAYVDTLTHTLSMAKLTGRTVENVG